MAAPPRYAPSRMTVAEFLDWPGDDTGRRFELVDGEARAIAPASVARGTIQANIAGLLRAHLFGTGCKVAAAPGVVPQARSSMNMRVPDLAVNCAADTAGQRALPDPVAIIEILSPSNEAETRETVWAYTTIPSVQAILPVRSTEIAAELLVRRPDGAWPAEPIMLGAGGAVSLDSLGYGAPLVDVHADTHLAR